MNKIRANIISYLNQLGKHWHQIPLRKQRQYMMYFFAGYLLLTVLVITKIWSDTSGSRNDLTIRHIENPVLKKSKPPEGVQDTLTTTQKNKRYERK